MLSQMSNTHHNVPSREHSFTDERYPPPVDKTLGLEDRLCPGCKKSVVSENGGLVVAFGQSFFHVDCFKCAKCGDQVTADTNLLLLSDGSPICANCSYSCSVCHLPILDEAIMTGDDSYHAHCFKCKVCKNRIDELVFAKTTQGIYCMNCHSERMIRLRKHAQRKQERGKAAGSSSAPKTREQDAGITHNEKERGTPTREPQSHPYTDIPRSAEHLHSSTVRSPSSSLTPNEAHTPASMSPFSPPVSQSTQWLPHSQPSVTVAPPEQHFQNIPPSPSSSRYHPHAPDPNSESSKKQNTLPVPTTPGSDASPMKRRKSYDDGVRPLNIIFSPKTNPSEKSNTANTLDGYRPTGSTNPNTSNNSIRHDKFRAKNPGLVLSNFGTTTRSVTAPTLSPSAMTFGPKSPVVHAHDSKSPSPLREQFPDRNSTGTTPFATPMSTPSTADFNSKSLADDTHNTEPKTPVSRSSHGNTSPLAINLDHTTPTRGPRSMIPADNQFPMTTALSMSSSPKEALSLPDVAPLRRSLSPSLVVNGLTIHSKQSLDDRPRSILDARRLSTSPSSDLSRSRSSSKSRPESPAHRADVPHNIESGTDTESENSHSRRSVSDQERGVQQRPPKALGKRSSEVSASDIDPDISVISQTNSIDGSDDLLDSSPVERTSHATFIAPALPPIRFSTSDANFSNMLGSGSGTSLRTLEQLAKYSDNYSDVSATPPSATSSFGDTQRPTSDITVMGSHSHGSSQVSLVDDDTTVVWKSDEMDNVGVLRSSNDLDRSPRTVKSPVSSGSLPRSILSKSGLSESSTRVTLTEPSSRAAMTLREDTSSMVTRRLQEALADANDRGAHQLKLDKSFIEAILTTMEYRNKTHTDLKSKLDGMKRTSKQYIEGLTVAQTEYDKELKARRDAEAEVTRLRVLVSGQAARLTAQSGDMKRHKLREQMSKQLHENLTGLEQDLSKLRVERDMTLLEIEELSASKLASNNSEVPVANLGRSLTVRLDKLKNQYQQELTPLILQHETLTREIAELKAVRDVFLEETTVLNARNEELAQLSAQYARRMDAAPISSSKPDVAPRKNSASFDKHRPFQQSVAIAQPFALSGSRSSSYSDDTTDLSKHGKAQKPDAPDFPTPLSKRNFMKWPGSKAKEAAAHPVSDNNGRGKANTEHVFQQYSLLRFTRCDYCGDKMWGSQVRCTICNISVHGRCMNNVQLACSQHSSAVREETQLSSPPSMFGRDLIEQVRADSKGGPRRIPVIVEKCIEAVEALALDYEGIYRKTGGSGQSKAIMQLFERGDYFSFDLRDSDRFNDICSVTSVLKTYFRSLPVPLLTFDSHEAFMKAIEIKDTVQKSKAMVELVNKLPDEHYYTLRMLMNHLNHVMEQSEVNLMTARNLGVVFGPTLMRSRDPAAEFSDMAGKALSVEWLIENASRIFDQPSVL